MNRGAKHAQRPRDAKERGFPSLSQEVQIQKVADSPSEEHKIPFLCVKKSKQIGATIHLMSRPHSRALFSGSWSQCMLKKKRGFP